MMFERGDRVLFVSSNGEMKGIISEKLTNNMYRVHRSPYKTDDYYIRYYKSIKLDKQWYRDQLLDKILQ